MLSGGGNLAHEAKVALTHVVSSLAVRAEDKERIDLEPWCYLASALGAIVDDAAWPLRTLLFLLTERELTGPQREHLGTASRDLFRYALISAEPLVISAIGFVGDTYASDPVASRSLLGSLLETERFQKHGDNDIPWLTRKLDTISATDAEFVTEIYEKTFADTITDDSETAIGRSRILPLRSNRRQDFDMAHWQLKEFFPKFLQAHPAAGTKAYVRAMHGYVLREHAPQDKPRHTLPFGGQVVVLQEDWSCVWASDPNDSHADHATSIAQSFSKWQKAASTDEVRIATEIIIAENEVGLVWSRLFMVAAGRPGLFAEALWPIATSQPFLVAMDTSKDCIDFIAAAYSIVSSEKRAAFERAVLGYDMPTPQDRRDARCHLLARLFIAIGADAVVTDEARTLVSEARKAREADYENRRPVSFEISDFKPAEFWWLRERGGDPDAPKNKAILSLGQAFKDGLQEQNRSKTMPHISAGVTSLDAFLRAIDANAGADTVVKTWAMNIAADGLEAVATMFEAEFQNAPELANPGTSSWRRRTSRRRSPRSVRWAR